MALLEVGAKAPDITAEAADGTEVRLSDLRGRYVLVYFYPRDNTPGCTTEACELNDGLDQLRYFSADVIGVSRQDQESHRGFRKRHRLRFALASDPGGTVADAYGVSRLAGVLPVSARTSFLIDPEGNVAVVWPKVRPAGHAAEVLAELSRHSTQQDAPV